MVLNLPDPSSLPSLVSRRFIAAKESGHVIFSATQLAVLRSRRSGIEYQLRYCPALAKKPVPASTASVITGDQQQQQKRKPDPFDNPARELVVAEIPLRTQTRTTNNRNHQDMKPDSAAAPGDDDDGHILVLNKFPVIPNHFILATKAFREQTDLLGRDDLRVAFECLAAWQGSRHYHPRAAGAGADADDGDEAAKKGANENKKLFAFFNSGAESGASQPHRHLQFLPVEDMRAADAEASSGWIPLIERLSASATTDASDVQIQQVDGFSLRSLPSLPFAHFAICLPPRNSNNDSEKRKDIEEKEEGEGEEVGNVLHAMYLSLYRAAVAAAGISDGQELRRTSGPAAISYNLAMTEEVMMICPRRSETGVLQTNATSDDRLVSLNGTILAGTLMVKSEEQWHRLRGDGALIDSLLGQVGIPTVLGQDML